MSAKKKTLTPEEMLQDALVPEEEQPYEVPENWVWVRLNTIYSNKARNIIPNKHPEELFELYSVPSFSEEVPEVILGAEIGSNKQIVSDNDVLLCKINPRINRVWIVGQNNGYRQLASTEWIVIKSQKVMEPKFLMYCLRSRYFRNLLTSNVSGVGGSLTRSRPKEVELYPVPIPPLTEQQRIVTRVESLLEKINQAKDLIAEARETFADRRAAILAKAFRGELTKKWREQNPNVEPAEKLLERIREEKAKLGNGKGGKQAKLPPIDPPYELPEGWCWVRLGDISAKVSDGTHQPPKFTKQGIPFLLISNVRNGYIDWFNVSKYISEEQYNELYRSCNIEENDILYTAVGSYGIAILINTSNKFLFQRHIAFIKPVKNYILPACLTNILNSPFVLLQAEKVARGVAQKTVTLGDLRNFLIPLPPFKEQVAIVEIINKIWEKEMDIQKYSKFEDKMDKLSNNVLDKAFRGQLGTNDPTEESALETLKEVIMERNKSEIKQTN